MISREWLTTPRRGKSQLPRNLHKNHFVNEIFDMILLLYRIRGNEKAHEFEEWMYFFIQIILEGAQLLDWAQLIND